MKAAIRRKYGSPDQIEIADMQRPVLQPAKVLVKVQACTVNRTDCANLTAQPFIMRFVLGFIRPRKIILGTDFAGEVIAIGKEVTKFAVGYRVFGFRDIGSESQAEYTLVAEKDLFPIPENLDYSLAAASLEGAHYAYTFVHKVNIQRGQRILINGATGAIGSALLQFVRQYDVTITATCNTKNTQVVSLLGADFIIDYCSEDFTGRDEKFDFIFDAVGKSTFGRCKGLLNERGVYISSELGPHSENIFYAIRSIFTKKKLIFPFPYPTLKTIPYIIAQIKKGIFKPLIDREYMLSDIAGAYEYVLTGEKTGNVVIRLE